MALFLSRIPVHFFRGAPTDHVLVYRNGKKVGSQLGGSFWVFPWNTLVRIPQAELTYAFNFKELSSDSQEMAVNGEVRVRLNAEAMASRRDFSVDAATGAYVTEDIRKVEAEVRNALGGFVRREIAKDALKVLPTKTDAVRDAVWAAVGEAKKDVFDALGVEVVGIVITAVTPSNANLRAALEAETREVLLAAADKAMHERRMKSAEADRRFQEHDLETKKAVERSRADLVALSNANLLATATAEAEAAAKKLEPYKNADPKVLFALAITEAAKGGIQNLTITPELLSALTRLDRAA